MVAPERPLPIETNILHTEQPDTVVRQFNVEDLPAAKELMESNLKFFGEGGIIADGVYSMIESETLRGNSANRRMGIWKDGVLVGYIGTNPTTGAIDNEVEVAYAIDKNHAGQGIASAALEAVAGHENEGGKTVVAEVEGRNFKSMRLLGKLGFEQSMRRNPDGRIVFIRYSNDNEMTEQEMMRRLGM